MNLMIFSQKREQVRNLERELKATILVKDEETELKETLCPTCETNDSFSWSSCNGSCDCHYGGYTKKVVVSPAEYIPDEIARDAARMGLEQMRAESKWYEFFLRKAIDSALRTNR